MRVKTCCPPNGSVSRLRADYAQLDLEVVSEAFLGFILLRGWHSAPEKRERERARSHGDHGTARIYRFNSTWMTSNGVLLVLSGR